jgi:VIT1/CCC1 family predicted Fe2+/Mn2+ transporter
MIRHKNLLRAKYESELFIRNFIMGVDDGMIATVGLLAGVSSGGAGKPAIVVTGMVAILVEAFSSSVGTILSEQSVEEYEAHKDVPIKRALFGGFTMFVSYLFAGIIPLVPYFVFTGTEAVVLSILLTLLVLAVIAFVKARKFGVTSGKEILENLAIAGISIAIGLAAGYFIRIE